MVVGRNVLLLALVSLAGCARTELYFLREAQLAYFHTPPREALPSDPQQWTKRDLERCSRFAFEGHHIEPGQSLVLLMRHWDPETLAIDDESFEKVSIEVSDVRQGQTVTLPSSNTRVYYSYGSSAWARKMCNPFSEEATGKLVIRSLDRHKARVYIDATFAVKNMLPVGGEPSEEIRKVQGEFTFRRLALSELNPWLGAAGSNVYDEAYPP